MRTLPTAGKNPVASVVQWFYLYKWGAKADASIYARHSNKKNPKALCHLLVNSDPNLDVALYEPAQIAELIFYLEDCGIEVYDLSIVCVSGLLASYVNRKQPAAKAELDRTVKYLRGDKAVDGATSEFKAPAGW